MRGAIHPQFVTTMVVCGDCGASFETRSTISELRLEICSRCHPAYTGRQQRPASGSQVERFNRRWAKPDPASAAN
jgi:large subunit ribosomal protein L31